MPLLAWSGELLFAAVVCWGAGAHGLYGWTAPGPGSVRRSVGAVGLGVALVSFVVMLLAVGRLAYPVFAIRLSADTAALVVSTVFGAQHPALLGLAVAAATLTWSTPTLLVARSVGIAAAVVFVAGSFPWLTPVWWNIFVGVLVAAWGVFLSLAHPPGPA